MKAKELVATVRETLRVWDGTVEDADWPGLFRDITQSLEAQGIKVEDDEKGAVTKVRLYCYVCNRSFRGKDRMNQLYEHIIDAHQADILFDYSNA